MNAPPPPPRWFRPILAGATLSERLIACAGALIGIGITGYISWLLLGTTTHLPFLIAPIGASAVLLFAVPTSPLAQPWSIVGGNTLSALVGVGVAHVIHDPWIACGVAVALAIMVMSFTRCLHPPGGAAALLGVMGIPPVGAAVALYPVIPMAVNSILLVTTGLLFHLLSGRSYPHRAEAIQPNAHATRDTPIQLRLGIQPADVDAALTSVGESFDIDRGDLARLLRHVEQQTLERTHGAVQCSDIMSRDVITIGSEEPVDAARNRLLKHDVRILPVVDAQQKLVGTVGLRECTTPLPRVEDVMSTAKTAAPSSPVSDLLPLLTDGSTHAVVIVDERLHIVGIISQTDLLAALGRSGLYTKTST
jgi:CBS domain-containing membrane protein